MTLLFCRLAQPRVNFLIGIGALVVLASQPWTTPQWNSLRLISVGWGLMMLGMFSIRWGTHSSGWALSLPVSRRRLFHVLQTTALASVGPPVVLIAVGLSIAAANEGVFSFWGPINLIAGAGALSILTVACCPALWSWQWLHAFVTGMGLAGAGFLVAAGAIYSQEFGAIPSLVAVPVSAVAFFLGRRWFERFDGGGRATSLAIPTWMRRLGAFLLRLPESAVLSPVTRLIFVGLYFRLGHLSILSIALISGMFLGLFFSSEKEKDVAMCFVAVVFLSTAGTLCMWLRARLGSFLPATRSGLFHAAFLPPCALFFSCYLGISIISVKTRGSPVMEKSSDVVLFFLNRGHSHYEPPKVETDDQESLLRMWNTHMSIVAEQVANSYANKFGVSLTASELLREKESRLLRISTAHLYPELKRALWFLTLDVGFIGLLVALSAMAVQLPSKSTYRTRWKLKLSAWLTWIIFVLLGIMPLAFYFYFAYFSSSQGEAVLVDGVPQIPLTIFAGIKQTLVEWGWPGVIALALACIALYWRNARAFRYAEWAQFGRQQ